MKRKRAQDNLSEQFRVRIKHEDSLKLKRLAQRQGTTAPRLIARLIEKNFDARKREKRTVGGDAPPSLDALRGALEDLMVNQLALLSDTIRTEIAPLRETALYRAESASQRATGQTSDAADEIRKLNLLLAEINSLARKIAQDSILNQFVLVHCLLARFLEERQVTSEQAARSHLVRQPIAHSNSVVVFVWRALIDQSAKFRDQIIAQLREESASQELASANTEAAVALKAEPREN